MQNTNRRVFVAVLILFVAAVLLTFNAVVSFADSSDNVTVNVTVATVTEITVSPSNLTWNAITPGFTGKQTEGVYKNVTIQNTGSTNASSLYAYVSTLTDESVYPYLGTAADLYAAGGVITFKNESEVSNMSWAGRLEWNWTSQIANTDQSAILPGDRRMEGFVRNTTKQFYWAVGNGTNSTISSGCNDNEAIFAFDSDEDNGTTITRTPTVVGVTNDAQDENWSYFSVDRPSVLQGMCVAVYMNCTKIYIYNYDKRTEGGINANACSNADYINPGPLAPTQTEKVQADVWMPKGIPAGAMALSQWTFVVS